MVAYAAVEAEFNLLGVYEHEFQLRRVHLVEQRRYDAVKAHRFTHAGGSGHQQVGRLGEVGHVYLVGDGGAHRHGKVCGGVHVGVARQYLANAYYLRLAVWHFHTYGAFAGNRGYDTDAECLEAHGHVVAEFFDFGDSDARCGHNFIESDGGADGGFNMGYLYAVALQRARYALLVLLLFGYVHAVFLVLVDSQKVEFGHPETRKVFMRVVGSAYGVGTLLGIVVIAFMTGNFGRNYRPGEGSEVGERVGYGFFVGFCGFRVWHFGKFALKVCDRPVEFGNGFVGRLMEGGGDFSDWTCRIGRRFYRR